MDFTAVINTRRSVRSFADKSLPEEVLERILDAARIAPSAINLQPWRFIVVKDRAVRGQIAEFAHQQEFVGEAPVVVVCCGKRYPNPHNWIGENLYLIDVAIAVDHLVLAARNEGVGACWIGAFHHEPLKELLSVPDDHDIIMLIPLGYPRSGDAFGPAVDRLELGEILFEGTFGKKR